MKAHQSSLPQLFTALLAISCASANAVITSISKQGTDVILNWPSTPGQTFIVQFRDSLNPGSAWSTLTNGLAAAASTNVTTFVHAGVLPASGEQMQAAGASTSLAKLSPEELAELRAKRKAEAEAAIAWLIAQVYEAAAKAKAWREEVARNPALLEEARKQAAATQQATLDSSSSCCGFYRVFIPSPGAKTDIFGVSQNTSNNQLDILANDDDPEEFGFQLSDVTASAHGTIEYADNASIFRYSPVGGFAGTDAFSYSITNEVGGLASATAWVFVNQSGNGHPTAGTLEFTLPTNQTQIVFPILTNAVDPDSDPLSLALVIPPAKGTARTNADGTLTYTRTSDYPARDEFCTVLTDGRGGFVKRTVVVLPPDSDSDGMPDEWEAVNGLNPTAADALSDLDTDGLPNLAEYKLRTHPNAADNPLHLQTITSGQAFSNFARIPLALSPKMDKQPISLLVNEDRTLSELRQGADGSWYISWDTGYLTNGNASLSLAFQFNPYAQPPVATTVTGGSQSVLVANEVIFNQLNSEFSDIWFIDVTFPYMNADFAIELYDEDGSGLVYFEGSTTDGNVQGWWDLTFGGEQISFGSIRADVYVAPSGGQGAAAAALPAKPSARRWFAKQIAGGIGDRFVVAWGWDWDSQYLISQRNETMLDGVINIIGNPGLDDEYLLRPDANIPFGGSFEYHTAADKEVLMQALGSSDSGNFFWFGHGTDSSFWGDGRKSAVDAGDVEALLQNKKHRSKPPKYSHVNKHPYRLVILNGCETYGAEWANAFGFDFSPAGTTNDVLAYIRQGRQPQAFVGWTKSVEVPGAAAIPLYHSRYAEGLAYLFSNWMGGYTLEHCLIQYKTIMTINGFANHDSWRISGAALEAIS